MFTAEQYERFVLTLAERGVRMRTSAEDYRRGHELPGWYDAMRNLTPESVWGVDASALGTGPAVVRDFVKSEKHYWDEAMFIPDVTDTAGVQQVVDRFLELRGDWLTGELVFRRYEALTPPEVRTWWVAGRLVLATPHPDSPEAPVPELHFPELANAIARLGLPFVAVDLMRSAGRWRVVEVGDGQVSDRPWTTPALDLLQAVLSPR